MDDDEIADALDELRREFRRNTWLVAGAVAAVPLAFAIARLLRCRRRRETTSWRGETS
jgi:hypothetical protein